jgi:hypothetical protein
MPSTNGFIIGLIGGLLDFASASFLLLGQGGGASMVNGSSASVYEWAAVLIALGVAVIVTSFLSIVSVGIRFGRVFAILMIAYGVIMMIVGAGMTAGYIMATDVSMIYSYGMFLVGAAMLVNGIMMSRNPMVV